MHTYKKAKIACYMSNISMSIVGNITPVLMLTFKNLYDISYSLLGLLVLINFVTQLTIDLIFSFFSHKFNIKLAVRLTPVICTIGLIAYALSPMFFPNNTYLGLVIGTIVFSASGGFAEVLISPVIDAIPSENPEREMSKLHSIYAWGVVGFILFATLFIFTLGAQMWQLLALILAIVPLFASILFFSAELPELKTQKQMSGTFEYLKKKELWLCFFAIFLGGAAECTMAQWCSGYIEGALGIPKIYGDIFGAALFALTLGLGRTLYAKIGKNIGKVLFFGAIGATLCYFIAAISPFAVLGLIACALTGLCVSMMWPGSLVVASEKMPLAGVFVFAMMAAGGDFGAALGPQLVGIITDLVPTINGADALAGAMNITTEQLAMKAGILVGMVFSLIAIFVFYRIYKGSKKR